MQSWETKLPSKPRIKNLLVLVKNNKARLMFLFRYPLIQVSVSTSFAQCPIERQNMSKEVLEEGLLLTRSGAGARPIRASETTKKSRKAKRNVYY